MTPDFKKALIAGVERVAAWSDVLDDINVFPVADSDTGRNMALTLSPLRLLKTDRPDLPDQLPPIGFPLQGSFGELGSNAEQVEIV